jgi:hypothetical protein
VVEREALKLAVLQPRSGEGKRFVKGTAFQRQRENSTYQIAVECEALKLAELQPRSGEMTRARRVSAGWSGNLS